MKGSNIMNLDAIFQEIKAGKKRLPGKTGFYYKNLVSGEALSLDGSTPLIAASVIKLPIMAEFFYQMAEGRIDGGSLVSIGAEDKLPSCGALNYLHDGLTVTMLDLCTLMIILSDNTATNLLIRKLGMEAINRRMRDLGLAHSSLTRLLFDGEAQKRGLENRVSAEDMGRFFSLLYEGKVVGRDPSDQMLAILKNQRLNGKMPFFLHGVPMAHKTGEDDGISHDVGIVYAEEPFIACFLSEETYVPSFERWIQDTTFLLANSSAQKK